MPSEIFTLYWWLSVVVVGVAIDLASSYLKPPLDKFLSSISSRWKERLRRKEARYQRRLEVYSSDPVLMQFLMHLENRYLFHAILDLLVGVICILFGRIAPLEPTVLNDIMRNGFRLLSMVAGAFVLYSGYQRKLIRQLVDEIHRQRWDRARTRQRS